MIWGYPYFRETSNSRHAQSLFFPHWGIITQQKPASWGRYEAFYFATEIWVQTFPTNWSHLRSNFTSCLLETVCFKGSPGSKSPLPLCQNQARIHSEFNPRSDYNQLEKVVRWLPATKQLPTKKKLPILTTVSFQLIGSLEKSNQFCPCFLSICKIYVCIYPRI